MSGTIIPAYATAVPTRAVVVCLWALCLALPRSAQADSAEIPGAAPEGETSFALGVETGLVIPVASKSLCPDGYECLFGVGWAFGLPFSYRWAKGTGLGFGYEFWLQNGNGVYEATITQAVTVLLRQSFLSDRSVHPVLRLRGGFLMLGPSFRVDTIGGTAEVAFGGEAELTPSSLFTFLLGGQILRTRAFTTQADGARRSIAGGVDAALILRVGVVFLL